METILKTENLTKRYGSKTAVNTTAATQSGLLIGIIGGLLYMAVLCVAGIYVSKKNQV